VKNALEIIPVSHLDEVLPHALISMPEAVEWNEEEAEAAALAAKADQDATVLAH
jgi:ATP-dependent Lon protease